MKGTRGVILPMLAISVSALVLVVGLALDVATAFAAKRQLQAAVDSAALGGTLRLPDGPPTMIMEADRLFFLNAHGPGTQPRWSPVLTRVQSLPNGLLVRASARVPVSFGRLAAIDHLTIRAAAVARITQHSGHQGSRLDTLP